MITSNEQWKSHPDFPNYRISNTAKVLNKTRPIAILPDDDGYFRVVLWHKGKRKCFRMHRLVAELFCNEFSKEKEVHHIDKIKQNNNADNLLVCTREEHFWLIHGEELDEIQVWNSQTGMLSYIARSITDAARFTKVDKEIVEEMLEKRLKWHLCCEDFYFDRF